jgi:hypothetical protein
VDARPSNAGDRYHLVYVARRCLDMLHPQSQLKLIALENVSRADAVLRRDERTFLGVDVTEYLGGTDANSAETITLVQVKYSPLRPTDPWTLSRLISEKSSSGGPKARSAVFRKLAEMFDAMAPTGAGPAATRERRPRVIIRLLTNQPLAATLAAQLTGLQACVGGMSPDDAARELEREAKKRGSIVRKLKSASGLDWRRFAELLAAWDLSAFAQLSLAHSEAELFKQLRGLSSDISEKLDAFLGVLQSLATPGRKEELQRSNVLGLLRLTENQINPAPSLLSGADKLFETRASAEIRQAIDRHQGLILVHGRSGAGKTSAMRVALYAYAGEKAVFYDCFADGQGLRPGRERSPFHICFTQVINDLDAAYRTGVLATTTLQPRDLMDQLDRALAAAAAEAQREGRRLVLAFDAIDNAAEQASRVLSETDRSFVPMLWQIPWPLNCVVLVSLRTENRATVLGDALRLPQPIEVRGFTPEETRVHAKHVTPRLGAEEMDFLHERTAGNPRVQAKVLADVAVHPIEQAREIIHGTARKNAYEYYNEYYEPAQGPRRLPPDVWLTLAVIYELRQPPQVDTVAAVLGKTGEEVRGIIDKVSFGLRVGPDEVIGWQDQDFLDWVGERLSEEGRKARERIADFCEREFEHHPYARWSFSYHLLRAERHEKLLGFWKQPGHLEEQVRQADSHGERVLEDVRAALIAARALKRNADALDMLFRAADLAQGRDAFGGELVHRLDIAVAADLIPLESLSKDPSRDWYRVRPPPGARTGPFQVLPIRPDDFRSLFDLAAALASRKERHEVAAEIFSWAFASLEAERARFPQGYPVDMDVWVSVAQYHARRGGLAGAFKWLARQKESDLGLYLAAAVATEWPTLEEQDPVAIVTSATLGDASQVAALLGVLAAQDSHGGRESTLRRLGEPAVRKAVAAISQAMVSSGQAQKQVSVQSVLEDETRTILGKNIVARALADAIEQLLAAGFKDLARELLPIWAPLPPRSWFEPSIDDYLRWRALREVLLGEPFEPKTYRPPPLRDTRQVSREADDPHLREVREVVAERYPAFRLRVQAWAGASVDKLAGDIRELATAWKPRLLEEWQRGRSRYATLTATLLEAVLALPGRRVDLLEAVLEGGTRLLDGVREAEQFLWADILSRDDRYPAEADRWIRRELDSCRTSVVPAEEGVGRLLDLYNAARRVGPSLARTIVFTAREVASKIDSRIESRSASLFRLAQAAADARLPVVQELDRLCAIFGYWQGISPKKVNFGPDDVLSLLARLDPGTALSRARMLEEAGVLDLGKGLAAVLAGGAAGHSLPSARVWPLLPLAADTGQLDEVARAAIQRESERGASVHAALSLYMRLARRRFSEKGPVAQARELVAWARQIGLGEEPESRRMERYADALEAELANPVEGAGEQELVAGRAAREQRSTPELVTAVLGDMARAPRAALERLASAEGEALRRVSPAEFRNLLDSLCGMLPVADRVRLVEVVERWGAFGHRLEVLGMMASLANEAGRSEPQVEAAVASGMERLLDPGGLQQIAYSFFGDSQSVFFAGQWAEPESRLSALLKAVGAHLRDLDADTLARLAGHAARLLPSGELVRLTRAIVARAAAMVPGATTPAEPAREPIIPSMLGIALGHPRQALRWQATYSVVHLLLESHQQPGAMDSSGPLSELLDVFEDKTFPRWLSVREWLAFAFEHVSLRAPEVLREAVPRLLPHAVSRELPHARIRHHLKQALLAVEQAFPGTLRPVDREAVEGVNRPIAVVPPRERGTAAPRTVPKPLPEQEMTETDPVTRWEWETREDWLRPMVKCFLGDGIQLEQQAAERAESWIEKLGITPADIKAEQKRLRGKDLYSATSTHHGHEPQLELLQIYGERQGLFLVAGQMIDTMTVVEASYGKLAGGEWEDWSRYRLRRADPALPAMALDAPPPLADNYGRQGRPPEGESADERYLRELWVPGEREWVVVAGERTVYERGRGFVAEVDSAVVSPGTAAALARVMGEPGRPRYLPFFELDHGFIIPELELEMTRAREADGEHDLADGLFLLRSWTAHVTQELPLHYVEPSIPHYQLKYRFPALDVVKRLGWTRRPTELVWQDKAGTPMARYELWHRADEQGRSSAEGGRLVVRRDAISAYARAVGLDVIFSVSIRQFGQVEAGDEEDASGNRSRAFLWSRLSGTQAGGKR